MKLLNCGLALLVLAGGRQHGAAAKEPRDAASLFVTTGNNGSGGIELSQDGKIVHVKPYYNEPETEFNIPGSYWEVATGRQYPSEDQPAGFTRHNKILDEDKGGFYCLRDVVTGRRIRLQNAKATEYWPLHVISQDGQRITMEQRGVIRVWNAMNGKLLRSVRYAKQTMGVNGALPTLSSDATLIAVADAREPIYSDFALCVYETATGRRRFTLPRRQYKGAVFSPGNGVLEICFEHNFRDGKKLRRNDPRYSWLVMDYQFLDARTGKLLWKRAGIAYGLEEFYGRFLPGGRFVGEPRKKDLAILDVRTGKVVRTLAGPTASDGSWVFSEDLKEIWEIQGGQIWRWPGL